MRCHSVLASTRLVQVVEGVAVVQGRLRFGFLVPVRCSVSSLKEVEGTGRRLSRDKELLAQLGAREPIMIDLSFLKAYSSFTF